VGRYLPDEKPRRRAKAFPTVCKQMHDDQLRKSKLYRSVASARTASDANSSAALRQTIAVSLASAGRAKAGTIGRSRLSSLGFLAGMMGNPSLMAGEHIAGFQTAEQLLRRSASRCFFSRYVQVEARMTNPTSAQWRWRETNHCTRFVVVASSDQFKMRINGSNPRDCKWLRNITQSKIFRTRQNRRPYS
jgi:hypothetical protein